jgi:hypothetical protein
MPPVIAAPLNMSYNQRAALVSMSKSSSLPHRCLIQSEALLFAADGGANEEIRHLLGRLELGPLSRGDPALDPSIYPLAKLGQVYPSHAVLLSRQKYRSPSIRLHETHLQETYANSNIAC